VSAIIARVAGKNPAAHTFMNKKYKQQRKIRLENKMKKELEESAKKISKIQDQINLLYAQRFILDVIEENNLSEGDEWKNA